MPITLVQAYVDTLRDTVLQAVVTDADGRAIPLEQAVVLTGKEMRVAHQRGNRVFFVGNGGSAAIASHMATDYSKNGGIRSSALNDGSVLICLGNDYGYEHVFGKQIEWHMRGGDVLVAISSSGGSRNILNAVKAAQAHGCTVYTLSGFKPDNPLRSLGDINFYLQSLEYGFVEVGHLTLLHNVLDLQIGWRPADAIEVA